MSQRDTSLDYLKGILILLVVYGHCIYWLNGKVNSYDYYFIAKIIYTFHMPLFIFISGYFFSTKKNDNLCFTIFEKIKRLIIPHCFFNITMIIPIFCFWEIYGHFITRFSNGVITISSIYHYLTMFWFLWCVFFSCIITNIVYIFTSNKKKGNHVLILISILFLLISQSHIIHILIDHQRMGTMFLFFALGVIFHDCISIISLKPTKYCALIIYTIYITYIYFYPEKEHLIITEIGNMSGVICSYNLFRYFFILQWGLNYFLYVSKWTLSIYIYHFVILYAIMKYANTYYDNCNSAFVITTNLFIAVSVTYLISYITDLLSKSAFLRKYAFGGK